MSPLSSAYAALRLDRVICNSMWINYWKFVSCYTLPKVKSDHYSLLCNFDSDVQTFPSSFKFQRMWMFHDGYIFGNVHTKVSNAVEKVDSIQKIISDSGYTDALGDEEKLAQISLIDALRIREHFWRDKSRSKWFIEGDRNTSYFHKLTKIRHVSNRMVRLKAGDNYIEDINDIEHHVLNYYKDLFASNNNCVPTDIIECTIPHLITAMDNDMMTRIPYFEEVKQAVFNMDGSSSPDPDGFGGCFFQNYWDIVGSDVVASVTQFFRQGWILPNLNSSHVVLVPKFPVVLEESDKGTLIPRSLLYCRRSVEQTSFFTCGSEQVKLHYFSCVDKKKLDTLSWDKVCSPISAGGLGLRALKDMNKAGCLKLCWDLIKYEKQWAITLRSRFFRNSSPINHAISSSIWSSLKNVLHLVNDHSIWQIGNGSSISFWDDNWLSYKLKDLILDPLPDSISHLMDVKVAEVVHNQVWALPDTFKQQFPTIACDIHAISLPSTPEPDNLVWKDSISGELTFKDAYSCDMQPPQCKGWTKLIWKLFIPPAKSLVIWRIMHNVIATDDNLIKRGFTVVSCCSLCGSSYKTTTHLFLCCPFIIQYWNWLSSLLGMPLDLSNFDSLLGMCKRGWSPRLHDLIIAAIVNILWMV
ncbi:hypothetical protein TSUD_141970 [Trifolium subterraneum]|uniref:Reverse transcriptase zinc-binding domain-containing protein n=1 Tax=Trifolium subterraneum TaxID=3900 RepID=A0A2Z6LK35_TRISU|nr:hypothetical protein TSUD_141970 [Trifolium subterraneum]